MNNTLKSILIIGGTFIIGLILGGLIVGKVIHRAKHGDPEKHIKRLFSKRLDLTESQESQVDALILKYRPKREKMVENFEKQKGDLLDEMTNEMKVFLETNQMTTLNKRIEHIKERGRGPRHKRKYK